MRKSLFQTFAIAMVVLVGLGTLSGPLNAADKPNILVIMSDDVGITNISAYSRGLVGYQTPNIDRIANEGMLFTDYTRSRAAPRGDRPLSPASIPFVPV